jgi:hypothetical protein
MKDLLARMLTALYPPESRREGEARIAADLYGGGAAVAWVAARHLYWACWERASSASIWSMLAGATIALIAIGAGVPPLLAWIVDWVTPEKETEGALYGVMFLGVTICVAGVLVAAVTWHSRAARLR